MTRPSDMPVFIIQAKDDLAVTTLIHYRDACIARGLNDQALEVQKAIEEILDWRSDNQDKVKLPDHKHVPVNK